MGMEGKVLKCWKGDNGASVECLEQMVKEN